MKACQLCGAKSAGPSNVAAQEPIGFDVLAQSFLKGFKSVTPEPPTRTERILIAMLHSDAMVRFSLRSFDSESDYGTMPAHLVQVARGFEHALENAGIDSGEDFARLEWRTGSGGVYRMVFPSRELFLEWLIAGFGQAREALRIEGVPNDVNINRLAVHMINWLSIGAPIE